MNWLLDTFWPMRRITFAFTDAVSGRPVSYYRTAGPAAWSWPKRAGRCSAFRSPISRRKACAKSMSTSAIRAG